MNKKCGMINLQILIEFKEQFNILIGKRHFSILMLNFNFILSHIFPKDFSEGMKIVFFNMKYFCQFFGFLAFPCYKEINNVRTEQMTSALYYLQLTLNIRLVFLKYAPP